MYLMYLVTVKFAMHAMHATFTFILLFVFVVLFAASFTHLIFFLNCDVWTTIFATFLVVIIVILENIEIYGILRVQDKETLVRKEASEAILMFRINELQGEIKRLKKLLMFKNISKSF